jgi:hypothetical protein
MAKSTRNPLRSPRLANAASISYMGDGAVRRSRRIAEILPPTRDNLADQRRMIDVSRRVLGGRFKVHIPRHGAPKQYSYVKLDTFAQHPHVVYGFSLGQMRRKYWLGLTRRTGEYTLGYRDEGPDGPFIKRWGSERVVDEAELRRYLQWEEDHPRNPHPAVAEEPLVLYPPEVILGWILASRREG